MANRSNILVVDDQVNMRATTALMLESAGYAVIEAESGAAALEVLQEKTVDVVITDLRMAPMTGIELVEKVKEVSSTIQVIVMTAYGSVDSAVDAMRRGATDYLQKPFSEEELLLRVQRAVEQRRLIAEVGVLADEFRARYKVENIIGRSPALRELLARVVRVAPSQATVLITGESGTGKELIARAIHANSRRSDRPFVPVNCAAINEQLLESELFGHVRGSFTGANATRRGLFEEAEGGTFFFDEIAETSMNFQAKLLRTIQEGEIRRVGENAAIQVDARIIAATNVDLPKAIEAKEFREDLYYRLAVVPIRVPPLRERSEDIPLLAEHFLARYNKINRTALKWHRSALERLMEQDLPGNVRQLENLVEQAAALSTSEVINADDLASSTRERPVSPTLAIRDEGGRLRSLADVVATAEAEAIQAALAVHRGNLEKAATTLGVSHTTLWRKMRKLGIERS
ncbi:MAG: sigma-54 dependent transcriptional regulator [Deltaproteobacteria bacterium]|nr:sigma-54 dependent transcriptional regulator [Deltaproteobacteria bacterium]